MIFIFDWGHVTETEIGPVSAEDYLSMPNSEMTWLVIRRTWFRAFFIPTVPTKTEFVLVDYESDRSVYLDQSLFKRLKPLAQLNAQLMDGKISDDEYNRQRQMMNL